MFLLPCNCQTFRGAISLVLSTRCFLSSFNCPLMSGCRSLKEIQCQSLSCVFSFSKHTQRLAPLLFHDFHLVSLSLSKRIGILGLGDLINNSLVKKSKYDSNNQLQVVSTIHRYVILFSILLCVFIISQNKTASILLLIPK